MNNENLFLVHNESDMVNPVNELIANLCEVLKNKGAIIFLNGELGAGKTLFVSTFAKAVEVESKIKSPTFTLMKSYDVNSVVLPELYKIVHIDAYRLEPHHKESMRIEEFLGESGTLVFVEWPVAIDLDISIAFAVIDIAVVNEELRRVTIKYTKTANF